MIELGRDENRSSRMTGQVETALQNSHVQGDQVGGDEERDPEDVLLPQFISPPCHSTTSRCASSDL